MTEPFEAIELNLTGSPRNRGRIHGEALRPQIHDAVAGLTEAVGKATGLDVPRLFQQVTHETGYLEAARRWTPGPLEEAYGIAEGAGLDIETVFAWQCIQEMTWYPLTLTAPLPVTPACTSLGSCPSPGQTVVAQTADGTGWGRGRGVITHLDDSETGIRAHILGWPGMIGVYGLNDQGIGVCCNSMFFDVTNSTSGLTALFTVRGILAQPTFEDVDRFIRTVPHASGTNFMVGAPGHTVSYEVSAKGVASYVPSPDSAITYHTNHSLATDDVVPPEQPGWDTNTTARLQSVRERMEEAPNPLSWQDAKAIISTHDNPEHPICRHYQSDEAAMTLWGIVIECSPDPVLHVSSGPPCCTEFRTYAF